MLITLLWAEKQLAACADWRKKRGRLHSSSLNDRYRKLIMTNTSSQPTSYKIIATFVSDVQELDAYGYPVPIAVTEIELNASHPPEEIESLQQNYKVPGYTMVESVAIPSSSDAPPF